ncbi:MAG: hypothetical protein NTX52_14145 [Planctomycetota bacterium]|nr:hypothetical protein [Planctomycetota bacterium]
MPSAHIFTVDKITFDIHLKYMFAGTGAGRAELGKAEQGGALADILSIRAEDYILFYVAGYGFYGFFKAKLVGPSLVFYEPPVNQYLHNALGEKILTYRLFIEPNEIGVYKLGVNEWDAIENPQKIEGQSIFKMQWTWIFKKLKGGRGCTAIPSQEFDLLRKIIVENNTRIENTRGYGFLDGQIVPLNEISQYCGKTDASPILSGNINKIKREEDLRIFFCAEAGKENIVDKILQTKRHGLIIYISNETKCSFGMKSIDLLFFTDRKKCLLVELKNSFDFEDSQIEHIILEQIGGYAKWVSSYKTDLTEIVPILVIREPQLYPATRSGRKFKYLSESDYQTNTISPWYQERITNLSNAAKKLLESNIENLMPLQVYTFKVDGDNILQDFCRL